MKPCIRQRKQVSQESLYTNMKIAKVIIGISTKALDRMFTYTYSTDLNIQVGSVVLVPFGRGNQLKEAYVVDLGILEEAVEFEIKGIHSVVESVAVEQELISLAHWMYNRYGGPMTSSLSLMLPRDIHVKKRTHKVVEILPGQIPNIRRYINGIRNNKQQIKRVKLLEFVVSIAINQCAEDSKALFVEKELIVQFETSSSVFRDLEQKGLIRRLDMAYDRKIKGLKRENISVKPTLTREQEVAVERISASGDGRDDENPPIFLLHGVTGSGKTEVYMQSIEAVVEAGKQVIVLIPEIGLTPQMIRRFVDRFGQVVGVMHSRLNAGERYEQWHKAKNGEISIMIGARSAIFTPFNQIGMIIIDEEHESTYKSEKSPRYHAREVAIKRGLYHQCPVVLGSATPLVDTYYKAKQGHYELIQLHSRAIQTAKKQVEVVDMKQELEAGNMSMLSRPLKEAMDLALAKGEQVILFINRRGYANFVSCRKCGYVYTCESCDVSLTYHKSNQRLICHYCGSSKKVEPHCPSCGSKYLKPFGVGTQKVESYIQSIYPGYVVQRMDQDTTGGKHSHQTILKRFEKKEINILVGTQMLTKGHDFHNVTVVGVVAADLSLNQGDYRAQERTFQLLTQVIGRTGRGDLYGQAFIQTYEPTNYSIVHALNEDYESFYQEEIVHRQLMVYPPFCHMLQIICEGNENSEVQRFLEACVQWIHAYYGQNLNEKYMVLGPAKTNVSKVKNRFRQRLLIKGSSYKMLTFLMKELYNRLDGNNNNLQLMMDINPMHLY